MSKVYSSRYGRLCPSCEQPIADCICKKQKTASSGDGIVRVRREIQGRHGKPMTTISGVPLEAVEALAKALKQKMGTGGSIKEGVIEIQGDKRDAIVEELRKRGFTVKLAGG